MTRIKSKKLNKRNFKKGVVIASSLLFPILGAYNNNLNLSISKSKKIMAFALGEKQNN